MKKLSVILLSLFATVIPISCEDTSLLIDCEKCYPPILLNEKYNIEVQITLNNENRYVPVTIYSGDIDNGEIIDIDTVFTTPYYTKSLEFGKQYSAIARYYHDGRTIFAVDGKLLRKKYDRSSCTDPCYIVLGNILDLRLK